MDGIAPSNSSPEIVFDPLSAAFIRDPYPVYAALREQDPVHLNVMGHWVLTRHDDIVAAMKDARFGNEPSYFAAINRRNRQKYPAADVANNIIPFMDPPAHTRPRKLISKAFLSHMKAIPENMREISDSLLEPHLREGRLDVLDDYATPFSLQVIGRLIGTPPEAWEKLNAWSGWFFYLFNAIPSKEILDNVNLALAEFRDFIGGRIEQRRHVPEHDLITVLLNAEEDGYTLSEAELIDTIMLLFADGVENVDKGIGNCVALLLQHPEVYSEVQSDVSLIPDVIEEALRLEPPGQFIAKIAKEDIEWHGKSIKRNEPVLLVLASANRDRTVLESPDTFDIRRADFKHLSFGKGRHACIGASLARMEMQIGLESIVSQINSPSLVNRNLEWESRIGHRWLKRLPISFDAVSK